MQDVTWKSVVGYEGIYEVSDTGRLRRISRYGREWVRELKPKKTRDGYYEFTLTKGCKPKCIRAHRIVAFAFLGTPRGDRNEINHKDGNKLNNNVENLEWVTSSENQKHAYKLGLQKVSGGAILNKKPIRCITLGVTCSGMTEMQRFLKEHGYTQSGRLNRMSWLVQKNGYNEFEYLGLKFQLTKKGGDLAYEI